LEKWTKLRYPLDYDNSVLLVQTINPSRTVLPKASVNQLNLNDFITTIINIKNKPQLSGLAFITKGQFQHVLPFALKKILQFEKDLQRNENHHAADTFHTVILASHINMLP